MSVWKKICCPVDFSWASRRAMEEAAELAWRFGSELTLLHVDASKAPSSPEERDARSADLERRLAAWNDEAEPIATATVEHVLLAGDPADEIARFARDGKYDVIVMGTRGAAGRVGGDWRIGSVAESVVREAPCTVVVVRGGGRSPPR